MTRWLRAFDSSTANSGRWHTITPFLERLHRRGGAGPDSGEPGHQRVQCRAWNRAGLEGLGPGLHREVPESGLSRCGLWTTTAPDALSAARVRANAGTSKPLVARWAHAPPVMEACHLDLTRCATPIRWLPSIFLAWRAVSPRTGVNFSAAPRRPLPKWHHVPWQPCLLAARHHALPPKGLAHRSLMPPPAPAPASVPPRMGGHGSRRRHAADARKTTSTR